MKQKRLTLIHTSGVMIQVFSELCCELLSEVEVVHMVDESLLKNIIRDNCLLKSTAQRVVGHILSAEKAGTDFVMVTCSSIGRAAEIGGELVNVPVMRVDEPMATLAVEKGNRIGVVATLPSTLNPTVELIKTKAKMKTKDIDVTAKLCEGAFEAVISGDHATHDAIVVTGIKELTKQVDIIVLAQASMARVVNTIAAEDISVPILSSPRLAIEQVATVL